LPVSGSRCAVKVVDDTAFYAWALKA